MFRKLLLLPLLLVLSMSPTLSAKPPLPNIATVTAAGSLCTAFAVGGNKWLTQGHCWDLGLKVGEVPAKALKNSGPDGLLLLEGPPGKPFKIASSPAKVGERVHAPGWPSPWDLPMPLMVFGHKSVDTVFIPEEGNQEIFELAGGPGQSGAPILNDSEEVVGIVEGGFKLFVGGMTLSQPLSEIKEFLKGVK